MNTVPCKRYTLIAFSSVSITTQVATICIVYTQVNYWLKHEGTPHYFESPWTDETWQVEKERQFRNTVIIIMTIGSFSMASQLLGILGACLQHFWICLTYGFLMLPATIATLVQCFTVSRWYWGTFVMDLAIILMAFVFAVYCMKPNSQVNTAQPYPVKE